MKLDNTRALVVFSGGQDSTTCLFWAKRHFAHVTALSFVYGQTHVHEVDLAEAIAREAGVEFHRMDAGFISGLSRNALTDPSLPMDEEKPAGAPPNTFVPGRNLFFLATAAVFARERGIRHLVTGVSQTDYSGYPDCRAPFIRAQERMMRLAMLWPFKIVTPFMNKTKAQEWALADRLGILDYVEKETVTCYRGIPGTGCGTCPACRLRAEGLAAYRRGGTRGS